MDNRLPILHERNLTRKDEESRHARIYEFKWTLKSGHPVNVGAFVTKNEFPRIQLNVSASRGCNMKCSTICESPSANPIAFTPDELLEQVRVPLAELDADHPVDIGMLGEGEPAFCIPQVFEFLERLAQEGKTDHVLLSTTGFKSERFLVGLSECASKIDKPGFVRLQFSLWHMDPAIRAQYVPGTKSTDAIVPGLDAFAAQHGPVKYNVPQVQGLNDDAEHVRSLAAFSAENPNSRIIKFSSYNPRPDSHLHPSSAERIVRNAERVRSLGGRARVFLADQAQDSAVNCGHITTKTRQGVVGATS